MTRPNPTLVFHMVHIDRLPSIVAGGLLPDTVVRARGLTGTSIAYQDLKDKRARTPVPCGARGTLADYVPFYFAPRSPMFWAMKNGRVSPEAAVIDNVVYLVSSTQRLRFGGRTVVITDRHPIHEIARMSNDDSALDTGFVDWAVMKAKYWGNTELDPDRKDRRQAECLAHPDVPWNLLLGVATRSEAAARRVTDHLTTVGITTPVGVRPDWYE